MLAKAFRLAFPPFVLSVVVTGLRFLGERAELVSLITFLLGVIWLTLLVGVYWGWKFRAEASPYRLLFLCLLIFAWLSRIPIVALWWLTTRFQLGTHYDMYRDLGQALTFQFGVSSVVQVALGGLVGSVILRILRSRRAIP